MSRPVLRCSTACIFSETLKARLLPFRGGAARWAVVRTGRCEPWKAHAVAGDRQDSPGWGMIIVVDQSQRYSVDMTRRPVATFASPITVFLGFRSPLLGQGPRERAFFPAEEFALDQR